MALAETDVDAGKIDEVTAAAARRTVADHALDAADCRELLAMLGLSPAGDVLCTECGRPISRMPASGYHAGRGARGLCRSCVEKAERAAAAVCAHGHRLAAVGDECAICRELVPMDDLRMVVERIKRDTALAISEIATRAGLSPSSLTSALAPSKAQRRIARSSYCAVLRLAEELSA